MNVLHFLPLYSSYRPQRRETLFGGTGHITEVARPTLFYCLGSYKGTRVQRRYLWCDYKQPKEEEEEEEEGGFPLVSRGRLGLVGKALGW